MSAWDDRLTLERHDRDGEQGPWVDADIWDEVPDPEPEDEPEDGGW